MCKFAEINQFFGGRMTQQAIRLKSTEFETISHFVQIGILKEVDEQLLELQRGLIAVVCSDGHHFIHSANEMARWVETHDSFRENDVPVFHPIANHGGALHLSPSLPFPESRQLANPYIMLQLGEALQMKGIHTIGLFSHAPCGKVRNCCPEMTIEQQIQLLFEAKKAVRERWGNHPNLRQVRCFFRVFYEVEGHETRDLPRRAIYFIDKIAWNKYRASCQTNGFSHSHHFTQPTL